MEAALRPKQLDIDPSSPNAAKDWKHWKATFQNYCVDFQAKIPDKYRALVNCVSSTIYEHIEQTVDFDRAIGILDKLFIKTPNEIFARHLLATRKQLPSESLDEFYRELEKLRRNCNFQDRTAQQVGDEALRDAFISGIANSTIRQRLLENKVLDLQTAYDQAYALDVAHRNSEAYTAPTQAVTAAAAAAAATDAGTAARPSAGAEMKLVDANEITAAAVEKRSDHSRNKGCFFCGAIPYHRRMYCPAREAVCNKCTKKGHYAKVCQSKASSGSAAAAYASHMLAVNSNIPDGLLHAASTAKIQDTIVEVLLDSCSTESFINENLARQLNLKIIPKEKAITMAQNNLTVKTKGVVQVNMTLALNNHLYKNTSLMVMPNLCSEVVLGKDFQRQHKMVSFVYGGDLPDLTVVKREQCCLLEAANVEEPTLFPNINPSIKPIATKSRRYSKQDQEFISKEIKRLLDDKIIEPSVSPWRAQVVVVNKKRMCVDYSQTINLFTEMDAYPLPRIDELVNNLAKYKVFSTYDLKSAYNQIPIKKSDRKYAAFEANGQLYQYCRIPFGVTNGVAAFQRAMNKIVEDEGLKDTFPYVDNVIIGGMNDAEHDENEARFLEIAKKRNLTFNDSKTIRKVPQIPTLGYVVGNGVVKPDPDRLRALQEMPPPSDTEAMNRIRGMFAYYAKWIPQFSHKIQPLVKSTEFPLSGEALDSFHSLKEELSRAALQAIDESIPFQVECDASNDAISGILSQGGRPVAFMSKTLHGSEKGYHIIEKEALAIVESVRRWNHYLSRSKFKLITDARSLSFIYNNRRRTKVKNAKINDWRMELSEFSFDIEYRPGKTNVAADTLSRVNCAAMQTSTLQELHDNLCHPGVTRLLHFVQQRISHFRQMR